MGTGVLLEIMELAQNHVEEAHKQDTEHVIVLLLLMVEKLVLEVLPVGELATLTLVQVERLFKNNTIIQYKLVCPVDIPQ